MPTWRISKDIWGWRCTALLMLVVAGCQAAVLMADPGSRNLAGAAAASGLTVYPMLLAAAGFAYVQWRLADDETAGWLALSLLVVAGPGLTMTGMVMAEPGGAPRDPSASPLVHALITASLLGIAFASTRTRAAPLASGLALGLILSLLTPALASQPPAGLPGPLRVAAVLVPVVGTLLIARFLLTRTGLPWWGRLRLSLAAILLMAAQSASQAPRSASAAVVVELVSLVAGACLLCCTSLALVRTSIHLNTQAMDKLHERLNRAEALVRYDRRRLHEIGATVAGIASATRLIHHPPVQLPERRRSLLEEMMAEEIERLQRLMLGESPGQLVFSLDETLGRLVTRQQAQGHGVRWEPSGHRVTGCPDDVAEIVSILLDNAAKHGRSTPASVEVRQLDNIVEIAISDSGPGIPEDMRDRLFDWGFRGPDSRGQGIGLNIARDLVESQGGYLTLEDSPGPGTTFVVGLPSGENSDAVGYIAV